MDEMIDFLRNTTIFARNSRAETRDFLARLDLEGYEVVKKAIQVEFPPVQPTFVLSDEPILEPAIVE